jgi:hypothetical protein
VANFDYNPITGQLDLVGGGASYIDGVVADSSLLPVTLGTPALESVYLAKAGSGVWLINRKPAGLYVRVANNGVAADWTYLGAFPEVNADGNWELYNTADPTKELKFDLSSITTGATRTLTVPNASGTLALLETLPAGGSTNLWIPASAWIPRTTGGCGVDSREIGSTNRQNFDELLFDAGTDEFAQALVIMPSNYNNGTITARFYWTAASGSGDVIWGLQGRAFANDDALDTAHGTAQTATDTLLAADDMHVSAATSAVTIGGTPAANVPIQFQVYRDADAVGDTLAVDARLLGVEILFN